VPINSDRLRAAFEIDLPTFLISNPTFPSRVFPYAPLWPGFAINTIFYAAMLWLLWVAPGKIRRFIRVHRGRCPACGYIIAPGVGNKCSECGNPLSLRRSAGM
jgi:hypothetical protein